MLNTDSYRVVAIVAVALLGGCSVTEAPAADAADNRYAVDFVVDLTAGADTARVSVRTGAGASRLRELSMSFDAGRLSNVAADGALNMFDGRLNWSPPATGGTLSYSVAITQRRGDGGFDARFTDDWALFRGDDLFPPMRTRVAKGATSESRLLFKLPDNWGVVTPWRSDGGGIVFPFDNPDRDFDRPTGWMLAGRIGVRRTRVGDTRVAVAAPLGQSVRRMDIMAFLNWTLPAVVAVFPTMDPRLLIVSADDPMWRGGLSGPGSLYMHADRPLISENGTSTLLHELIHVAMGASGSRHDDWILEGMAEYYSIALLARTGTLSERRMHLALGELAEWGENITDLFAPESRGPMTARAAVLLAELDAELRMEKPAGGGLDDVVATMIDTQADWTYDNLCRTARNELGHAAKALRPSQVPGAPRATACLASDE